MHVCQPEFYVCMKQTEQLKIYVYSNNINYIINCDKLLTAKPSGVRRPGAKDLSERNVLARAVHRSETHWHRHLDHLPP